MVSDAYRHLAQSSNARLASIFQAGKAPALESLVGFEWRGFNVSLIVRLLGLQKFIKGFFQDVDHVEGYNTPVVQNGIDGPWLAQPSPEAPRRFGFYTVAPVDAASTENLHPQAILLNYGASRRNPAGRIERALRDYLVQSDPANPDLMLGKAYFAVGPLRIPSNYFILERLQPVVGTAS